MEIYKGTSAFSGIAIGKILYYHRGEYQIRQSMVDNVKKELDRLDNARTAVKNQIQHMYKKRSTPPQRAGADLETSAEALKWRQLPAGRGKHDHDRKGQCSLRSPDNQG